MWQTHVTGLLSPHAAASTCRSLYVSVITTIPGYGAHPVGDLGGSVEVVAFSGSVVEFDGHLS